MILVAAGSFSGDGPVTEFKARKQWRIDGFEGAVHASTPLLLVVRFNSGKFSADISRQMPKMFAF